MYADSPPASSSYRPPPSTPFQDYQRERQQQFYRAFPEARYHDSIWGAPPYTTSTYDIEHTFGGPVFQYDNSLTSSGLDRGYTAVGSGALQSTENRPGELFSQYLPQAHYDYPNTGLELSQTDLGNSRDANLQSSHYYSPTTPDAAPYYPEQSLSYTVPSQKPQPAYYTPQEQFPNNQPETPYVPSYNQQTNFEQAYPNTVNHQSKLGSLVDAQSPTGRPYYQSESPTELQSSPHQAHFPEATPEPVIPLPVQLPQPVDTRLPNHHETQASPPAMARRIQSEVPRPKKTVPVLHEPESLTPISLSGRGAASQRRYDPRHSRSLSRVPSQAPNSPVSSGGAAWMGSPPPGPPIPPSRPSMPLSPLPTKRQLEKKPPLACLFCRGRKIACGPPIPGSADKTCNQCQRRSLTCEYPTESRRGMRKKKVLDSVDTVSGKDAPTTSPSTDTD